MLSRQDARRGLRATGEGTDSRSPEPERRQLTVMFCDLVGSTTLSQSLDPEDLLGVLGAYRSTCNDIIASHGGHVSRYTGDGILVLFGYPTTQDTVTERAVHAALAIIRAMSELKVPGQEGLKLDVRIGLATGLVIVGEMIGEGPTRDEAIIGATPNLAMRLQTLASPNTVVISDDTRKLLRDAFDYQSMGEHELSGFDEPTQVWRVVGVSNVETRFDAAQTRDLTPLVGRDPEIDLMMKLWNDAKNGSGRVLMINGEAGIGKSRLVKAFRDRIAVEAHATLLFQHLAHYRFTALHPLMRHIERFAGLEENDSIETKRAKLRENFGDDAKPVYERLLSLQPLADDDAVDLDAKQQRDLTFATILKRLRCHTADLPLLNIIEDAHWMDPTSIELVTHLIDQSIDQRVFFVITSRPEFKSDWADRSHATSVTLDALDHQASEALAKAVVGKHGASPEIVEHIVDKTGGVPLFIEELAKSMLEAGTLPAESRQKRSSDMRPMSLVPTSLMDSLMSRIDQLGDAKLIAQIGAVIGEDFTHRLLEQLITPNEPDLTASLEQLVSSGLLLRQESTKEIRYVFKHALVRDAIYDSLIRRRRETLHARIAACLEDHFPDIVAHEPERLAEHYSEAGFAARAIGYWQRAGERASARCENLEARNHFECGLELLEDLEESSARQERELSLLIGLGPVEIAIGGAGSKRSSDVYERAVTLCDELSNSPLHFVAHWGHWLTSRTFLMKRERADELSAIAARLGDPGFSLQSHHCQWVGLFSLGLHGECCARVQHGIDLYEASDFRTHAMIFGGHDPAVCGHGHAALSLWLVGRPEQAAGHIKKTLTTGSSLSHAGSLLHAFDIALMYHRFRQDVDDVKKLAKRMIALSQEGEFTAQRIKGELFDAWVRGRQGDPGQAVNDMTKSIEALGAIATIEDLPFFFDMLAECYALDGRSGDGLKALDSAFDAVEKTTSRFWTAELFRRRGEFLLASGDEDAGTFFEQALETAREQGARMLELRAATSSARWLQSRGDERAAHDMLASIYGQFTEGFDTIDLVAAKACLEELASAPRKS